ncbi:hypothetical protein TIFTF001_013932 [Ficus carica]|uniref:Uncharacterized protein n=1 Tax=Ficus carica TaxID=3494 RepID=A0AA88AQK8_FICCA|nr:hypothetical protein TIFTF001_013932 [Ficus carica]
MVQHYRSSNRDLLINRGGCLSNHSNMRETVTNKIRKDDLQSEIDNGTGVMEIVVIIIRLGCGWREKHHWSAGEVENRSKEGEKDNRGVGKRKS